MALLDARGHIGECSMDTLSKHLHCVPVDSNATTFAEHLKYWGATRDSERHHGWHGKFDDRMQARALKKAAQRYDDDGKQDDDDDGNHIDDDDVPVAVAGTRFVPAALQRRRRLEMLEADTHAAADPPGAGS